MAFASLALCPAHPTNDPLSPEPSLFRSFCSPNRGASRWSCEISDDCTGTSQHSPDAAPLSSTTPLCPVDSLQCDPSRPHPSWVRPWPVDELVSCCDFPVSEHWRCTHDAKCRTSNPYWYPVLPQGTRCYGSRAGGWCGVSSKDIPRKESQCDLSSLERVSVMS